jgi:hypothetical protein
MKQRALFGKINKTCKLVVTLTKNKREKTQTNKTNDDRGTLQQIPMKSTRLLRNISKNYIPVHWKI